MLTGDSTASTAAACMRAGAFYYLTKPFEAFQLSSMVLSAARYSALRRQLGHAELLAGRLAARRALVADAAGAARARPARRAVVSVLIQGETGTGKELIARALHAAAVRGRVRRDQLRAVPESLIESELFGHERGAFTDAKAQKRGLFEEADGGTLFLDEVGEMPVATQAKLLRVLEEMTFRRLGGTRDLSGRRPRRRGDQQGAGRRGRARPVSPGPLLPAGRRLTPRAAAARAARRPAAPGRALPQEARRDLAAEPVADGARDHGAVPVAGQHPRARERGAPRARARARRGARGRRAAAARARDVRAACHRGSAGADDRAGDRPRTLTEAKRRAASDFEKRYLIKVLDKARGSVSEAARLAGLDRTNFRRLIQRHGIDPADFKA